MLAVGAPVALRSKSVPAVAVYAMRLPAIVAVWWVTMVFSCGTGVGAALAGEDGDALSLGIGDGMRAFAADPSDASTDAKTARKKRRFAPARTRINSRDLPPEKLEPTAGLEPATCGLRNRCSTN